ncbi:MAG: hypothetical protein FWD76_00890 [Firmicutes bacterium]|nr:hypothetical protein [Bacillota bacterium]
MKTKIKKTGASLLVLVCVVAVGLVGTPHTANARAAGVTDDAMIVLDYYDHRDAFDNPTVGVIVTVTDKVDAQEVQNTIQYFESVLGLLGQKNESERTQEETPQQESNTVTYLLDKYNPTKLLLQDRKFGVFTVNYAYEVDGFSNQFVETLANTDTDTGNTQTPNTKQDFATIVKLGFMGKDAKGKPIVIEPLAKALPMGAEMLDKMDVNLYLSRPWTLSKGTDKMIINGAKYVKFATKTGQTVAIQRVSVVRANPIGYSVIVLLAGVLTVAVCKWMASKKEIANQDKKEIG